MSLQLRPEEECCGPPRACPQATGRVADVSVPQALSRAAIKPVGGSEPWRHGAKQRNDVARHPCEFSCKRIRWHSETGSTLG